MPSTAETSPAPGPQRVTKRFVVGHSRAPRSVSVEFWPESDGSIGVHAPGYRVDAVYPEPLGGFRPGAGGTAIFPGRPACQTVEQAIQLALDD